MVSRPRLARIMHNCEVEAGGHSATIQLPYPTPCRDASGRPGQPKKEKGMRINVVRLRNVAGLTALMSLAVASGGFSDPEDSPGSCKDLPNTSDLHTMLNAAPTSGGQAGGLFGG